MMAKIKKSRKLLSEFDKTTRNLIISAFGFITALSWNEAINSIIKTYVPVESTWPYLLGNATLITFIAVFATMFLSRGN